MIKFPEVTDVQIAFGQIPEQKKFEQLAQEHNFKFMSGNKYCEYASSIFFNGGSLPPKRKDVTEEYYIEGIRYFKCWISSFDPKHERKEEVCGFILSLISKL